MAIMGLFNKALHHGTSHKATNWQLTAHCKTHTYPKVTALQGLHTIAYSGQSFLDAHASLAPTHPCLMWVGRSQLHCDL